MKKIYYDVEKCLACKSCEIACAIGKSQSKELFKAVFEEIRPSACVDVKAVKNKNFPLACRHCKEHPCIDACIGAALTYNQEKGMVEHNKDRCVGCWMCIMLCPYGAIRQNKSLKIPVRCDLCSDAEAPRCVEGCPTGAIMHIEEEKLRDLKKK